MNQIYSCVKRIGMALLGIWIALVAILPSFGAGLSREDGADCIPRIGVRWEGREAAVYVSSDLLLLSKGRPVAFLISLILPETAAVAAWKAGEGAQGLRLTVGGQRQGLVKVLLDGIVESEQAPGEDTVILRILFEEREASPYIGPETVFCFLKEDGSVYTVKPRVAEPEEDRTSECSEEADPSEKESETYDPGSDVPETTEESSDTRETHTQDGGGREDLPPLHTDRFMGCRETPAENGRFTVQLLFYGTSGVTPVIGRREDGWMLPEVTRVSERELTVEAGVSLRGDMARDEGGFWSLCTFRALSCEDSLLFNVYTAEGSIAVRYEKGIFRGFYPLDG